jgi:hypothetical protein
MPAELSTPPPKISIGDSASDPSRDRLLAYDVPGAPARRSGFVLVGLVGFVVALALTAVIVISKFPLGDRWIQSAINRTLELASSSEQLGSRPAMRSEPGIPKLIVQASRGIAGEPAPLGLSLQGQAGGAVVIIRGLVSGMELSTGASISGDSWQLSATDLHYAWIAPPKDFEGSADLIAELRLSSNQIADRRAIHLAPRFHRRPRHASLIGNLIGKRSRRCRRFRQTGRRSVRGQSYRNPHSARSIGKKSREKAGRPILGPLAATSKPPFGVRHSPTHMRAIAQMPLRGFGIGPSERNCKCPAPPGRMRSDWEERSRLELRRCQIPRALPHDLSLI